MIIIERAAISDTRQLRTDCAGCGQTDDLEPYKLTDSAREGFTVQSLCPSCAGNRIAYTRAAENAKLDRSLAGGDIALERLGLIRREGGQRAAERHGQHLDQAGGDGEVIDRLTGRVTSVQ